MKSALKVLILLALLPALTVASSAFNQTTIGPRTLSVEIVEDHKAYLTLSGYGRHSCFVETLANGSVEIHFDTPTSDCYAAGTGQGVNVGTSTYTHRYAFHDVLSIANSGTKALYVWANVTTTSLSSSSVEIAKKDVAGTMADADYYTGASSTKLTIPVGDSGYMGVRVKPGTLTAGNDIQGWVTISARRSG